MCSLSSAVTVQLKFIEKQAISGRIGLVWSSRQECCEQCCMYDIAVLAVIVWICLGGRKQVFVSLGDWVQKLSPQIGRRYEMIECNWGRVIMLHYQDDEKPFLSALPVGFCFVWCGFFSFYISRRLSCLFYVLKTVFNSIYFLILCWWETSCNWCWVAFHFVIFRNICLRCGGSW